MADRTYNVLFLSMGNSTRSILGESILNRTGRGRFRAFSAGSQPKEAVHPQALGLLQRLGYDTVGLRPKAWTEFAKPDAPHMDFIITVCDDAAEETCPVWPGQPVTAYWGIPDPAEARGTEAEIAVAFDEACRMLHRRIDLLLALPLATIDQMALKQRLQEIGHQETAPPTQMTHA